MNACLSIAFSIPWNLRSGKGFLNACKTTFADYRSTPSRLFLQRHEGRKKRKPGEGPGFPRVERTHRWWAMAVPFKNSYISKSSRARNQAKTVFLEEEAQYFSPADCALFLSSEIKSFCWCTWHDNVVSAGKSRAALHESCPYLL